MSSPAARAGSTPIADAHNDLLMAVRHQRERGRADPFGDYWLPQLREGGVELQVLPIYTEEQFVGEGALRRAFLLLEEAYHLAEVHADDVAIVRSAADLRRARDSGRIALVLALEGAEPLGRDLELVSTFHRSGVRMISLTWNRRTAFADGVSDADTGGRLTPLGVDVVHEMERLGVVLDVSHLSTSGFWHVSEIARKPFIASHSSCGGLHDHPRNLSDAQMRAIADRGGWIGINAFGPFLGPRPTVTSYLDHIAYAVDLVGPSHVALGPDFMADIVEVVDPVLTGLAGPQEPPTLVEHLRRPSDLSTLAEALRRRIGVESADQVLHSTVSTFLEAALGDGAALAEDPAP